ncbi:MAG: hypothetical protein ACPHER_06295 [Nevskiales bacterium]
MKQFKLILLFTSLLATAAMARDAAPPLQTSAAGIQYVVGGIGSEERKAMRSQYRFKLRVEHALKNGSYSAGMHIRIDDAQGRELLETLIDGPWLLVDLPAGEYQLTVLHKRREFSKKIMLGSEAQQQVIFMWPDTE